MARQISFREAVNEALREELSRDERVYLIGEDIGTYHKGSGPNRVTKGLLAEFGPERVIETPIVEGTIVGSSIGSARMGMRPVAEIMHSEFLVACFQYIVYTATKSKILNNANTDVPLVIRTAFGAPEPGKAFQNESPEAWFCHTPGLKVVIPSTAYDAKGLLKSSIRDDNPVLFLEHNALYGRVGEVPEDDYTIPLGVADVKKEGKDVTVVATGNMVPKALSAADALNDESIDIEVIDPRTLVPLDTETILNSIRKTGRVVIIHEGKKTGGYAGEIAATIAERAFSYLKAPILRVCAPDVPSSFPPETKDLVEAVKQLVGH